MARRSKQKSRRDQLTAWLDAQTDPEAWLTKTYREIGEEMTGGKGSDPSTVRTLLARLLADKLGVEPSEVIKRKATYRSQQRHMTPDKLRLLKEWRTQDFPVPIIDCAHRLDMSVQTIIEHCKEMGLI